MAAAQGLLRRCSPRQPRTFRTATRVSMAQRRERLTPSDPPVIVPSTTAFLATFPVSPPAMNAPDLMNILVEASSAYKETVTAFTKTSIGTATIRENMAVSSAIVMPSTVFMAPPIAPTVPPPATTKNLTLR
ncbi:hypothetical protein PHMEG_00020410 [Phytophthora megakarya]|uniref:Uncharacterized protein n=1 Tax=Phytophthora megakarya TaxID=4795 RepID=A0A225VRS1_9STRA|nr:hypothetical protein PHMEG_00020410 [Phytophthora megakarya]